MEAAAPSKRPLQKMFTDVPPAYDLLNRTLTFRFDQSWRKKAASACLENNPSVVLDLCCGTGDLALQLARSASPGVYIKALDYSEPMLWLAKQKAGRRKIPVEFILGDAAAMPFDNNTFDSVGIAFAFRNLTFHNPDRDKFLGEILRVIKPGGRFVIVETSQPKNPLLRKLFHFYLEYITAPVGGILSGHYGAYGYLAHSAKNYYNREGLTGLLISAGFSSVVSKPLMGGIAGIFTAVK
jgi:demethylmenaquinone methyltransferase / 2-methoxy-6-polyprenyl-1,4-benzoquinol methylase